MALTAVTAACQSGQDPTVETPGTAAPAPSTASTPAPTATSTTAAEPPTATTPVSVAPSGTKATMVAVRAAHQGSVDRVVFEFSDRVPGYAVRYVNRPITEDASGRDVSVEGGAVLEVRMEPASGPSFTPATARVRGDTTAVTEVVRTGDFEAVLTWVLGVKTQRPFRLSTLSGPPRLVIEVAA